jgi:hypothetical protein
MPFNLMLARRQRLQYVVNGDWFMKCKSGQCNTLTLRKIQGVIEHFELSIHNRIGGSSLVYSM